MLWFQEANWTGRQSTFHQSIGESCAAHRVVHKVVGNNGVEVIGEEWIRNGGSAIGHSHVHCLLAHDAWIYTLP